MMDPTVHVNPYIANASVEFVSSVISPIAALTVATFPLSAPLIDRIAIIIQKLVDRPLPGDQHTSTQRLEQQTYKKAPLIATPVRPMMMTGFRPIRLDMISL